MRRHRRWSLSAYSCCKASRNLISLIFRRLLQPLSRSSACPLPLVSAKVWLSVWLRSLGLKSERANGKKSVLSPEFWLSFSCSILSSAGEGAKVEKVAEREFHEKVQRFRKGRRGF